MKEQLEIKILTDAYEEIFEQDEDGNHYKIERIIKKNAVIKKLIDIKDIQSVQQTLNKKGEAYKSRCALSLPDGRFIVKAKYETMCKIKEDYGREDRGENRSRITGFRRSKNS